MIIIGHRGAAGLAPENTIAAMKAGVAAGADMLELDVRVTSDGIPVVIHDISTRRTHKKTVTIARTTATDLQKQTTDSPIPTLDEVFKVFFGKIPLNIECKSRGSGRAAAELAAQYCKKPGDWNHLMFSSFHPAELQAIRDVSEHAMLALVHRHNPFAFVPYLKSLRLGAVGFHQLSINPLAVAIAKKRRIFTYAYTINRPTVARILKRGGIEGIVTNYPDRFKKPN